MPRALITGITGQDGSYLSEYLLEKGYEVHGLVRRTSVFNRARIEHLCSDPVIFERRLFLHYSDLNDLTTLRRILAKVEPDEIYHLAGQTHVALSFEIPELTCDLIAMGTLRLLEMVRDLPKPSKFFHAASSEIFGLPEQFPQDEQTPFRPLNPYGCAKAFAAQMVGVYRKTFGVFACNGIMYNHESPRRGEGFVSKKICRAAAAIKLGLQAELLLGDTTAQRDWGDARDYVRGMWLSLQQACSDDYVFATGQLHTVQNIVELAFGSLQLDWREHVKIDPRFKRPADSQKLLGNPAKAKRVLGWEPRIPFQQLIEEMTHAELEQLKETCSSN